MFGDMKGTILCLLAVVLFSCGKDKRSVEYSVSCYYCSARYLDADGVSNYVKIVPDTMTNTVARDTVINGMDTTVMITTTMIGPGPYTWSTQFDVDPLAALYFGVSRLHVGGVITTATRTVDGAVESMSTGPERKFLVFE